MSTANILVSLTTNKYIFTDTQAMSSNSSSLPRLGPAWRSSGSGGRGFQPPPAVPDETRDRSGSHASVGTAGSGGLNSESKNRNPFSLLDDEDDTGGAPTSNSSSGADKNSRVGSSGNKGPPAPSHDRFSALKSTSDSSRPGTYNRSASSGPRPGGRSLADLAAGLSSTGGDRDRDHRGDRNESRPGSMHRSSSTGYHHPRGGERGGTSSDIQRSRSGSGGGVSLEEDVDVGVKVIRYTREKLLSLRPRPRGADEGLPDVLKHLEGNVIISSEPQDPGMIC